MLAGERNGGISTRNKFFLILANLMMIFLACCCSCVDRYDTSCAKERKVLLVRICILRVFFIFLVVEEKYTNDIYTPWIMEFNSDMRVIPVLNNDKQVH